MANKTEIIGMKELERSIRRLGGAPQKCVNKAARSGANIALKAARAKAPVDTGELKRAIILKPERRVKVGKKVYDVLIDPRKNDLFVKLSKNGKRSYYPASMEYGFFAKNGRYIPGDQYLKKSLADNKTAIEDKIVSVLSDEIDKAIGKG